MAGAFWEVGAGLTVKMIVRSMKLKIELCNVKTCLNIKKSGGSNLYQSAPGQLRAHLYINEMCFEDGLSPFSGISFTYMHTRLSERLDISRLITDVSISPSRI